MTAVLSWDVQNFVVIILLEFRFQIEIKLLLNLTFLAKIHWWNGSLTFATPLFTLATMDVIIFVIKLYKWIIGHGIDFLISTLLIESKLAETAAAFIISASMDGFKLDPCGCYYSERNIFFTHSASVSHECLLLIFFSNVWGLISTLASNNF